MFRDSARPRAPCSLAPSPRCTRRVSGRQPGRAYSQSMNRVAPSRDPVREPRRRDSVSRLLGARIREEREAAGLTVRGLAARIGVSPSLISQIERDRATPSVATLWALGERAADPDRRAVQRSADRCCEEGGLILACPAARDAQSDHARRRRSLGAPHTRTPRTTSTSSTSCIRSVPSPARRTR